MVLEDPLDPFAVWIGPAVLTWLTVILAVGLLALVVGLLGSVIRYGPQSAAVKVGRLLWGIVQDVAGVSPRRILALAYLAMRESLRSRILVALAVLGVILLYAGWFLPRDGNPAQLYLGSVLPWSSYLVLLIALLLSVFSLPGDIKSRTIYTIVTKPVRSIEIVLGRILGFAGVGTILLAVMAGSSYVFIVRMLHHTHQVSIEEVADLDLPPAGGKFDEETIVQTGRLTTTDGHHHTFTIDAAGYGATDSAGGHWHTIRTDATPRLRYARVEPGDARRVHLHFSQPMDPAQAVEPRYYQVSGDLQVGESAISDDNRRIVLALSGRAEPGTTTVEVDPSLTSRIGRALASYEPVVVGERDVPREAAEYVVGPPQDLFRARVPVYGTLRFTSSTGEARARGISVGSPWTYRSYIEGATQASAVWTFENVDQATFGDTLPLELTVRVFRTHMGRTDRTLRGTVVLRNPERPHVASKPQEFLVQDGSIDQRHFPRKLSGVDRDGHTIPLDLYDDLVAGGKLEVVLQCLEARQYFGVAQADAYLLAREGSFMANYLWTVVALWFQMLLIIALGVMFSTVLSGPVAMMATTMTIVVGFFVDFVMQIALGTMHGGGPLESAYRISQQKNLLSPLEPGILTDVIKAGDWMIQKLLWCVSHVIPDLRRFDRTDYLASGFAIPLDHVLILGVTTLGFLAPVLVIGYLLLKTREVAG